MFCFYPGNGDTIAFKYAYLSGIVVVKKNNGVEMSIISRIRFMMILF